MLKDKDRIFKNLYNDLGWDIDSAVNRGDWSQTKDFISNGCTFYPRRVEIEAAYDGEGVSNPFRKYSQDDFDFSNDKLFSFKKNENIKIDSHNENKITLIAKSEDFYFKLTGFGDDQSEDVRWKYRSYSI